VIEACVVNASVGIKLFVIEAGSEAADRLFASLAAEPPARLYVPDLFYAECANVLWNYVRQYNYPAEEARQDLVDLQSLALRSVSSADLLATAFELAIKHEISLYDAIYTALAGHLALPLVTADQVLSRKIATDGLEVIDLAEI
jgi:predicted nucleic acid-binding protein